MTPDEQVLLITQAAEEAVRLRAVFRRYVLLHSLATAFLTVVILFATVYIFGADDRSLAARVDENAKATRLHIERLTEDLREHDEYVECLLAATPEQRSPADFAACRERSGS